MVTQAGIPNAYTYANPDGTFMNEAGDQTKVVDGLVAHAGGGQALATKLTALINGVSTVATAGDSVQLPAAVPGVTIRVCNEAANATQVFGAYGRTDLINAVAGATGVSLAAGKSEEFTCLTAGVWRTLLSA